MRRFICLLVGVVGCSSQPFDREHAHEKLKSQAEQYRSAMLAEDFSRVYDMSHPNYYFQGEQNRKKFIKFRRDNAELARKEGEALSGIVLGDISLMEAGQSAYARIEIQREFQRDPVWGVCVEPNYWVAVSSDRGETWKFIESSIINGRDDLNRKFPDLPGEFQLPAVGNQRRWKNDAEPGAAADRGRGAGVAK